MSAENQLATLPDTELLEQCLQNQNRDAFATLVDRYKNLICSVAYSILGDLEQSEDVAQETFLAAWKKLNSLREPDRLKSWLCGIARHRALAVVRKRKPEGESEVEAISEESPDAIAVANEEGALVWEALETLPETYREPLILFYREEQSVRAVADGLELSEDAVKQRLSRGRAMLRKQVLAMIEGALIATRPGPAFTMAVIGALPGLLASTAAAATVGTAGKAVGVGSAAAAAAGGALVGTLVGTLGGFLGAFLGWYAGDQTARFQAQRDALRKGTLQLLFVVCLFQLPWVALFFDLWSPEDLGGAKYSILLICWMLAFFVVVWTFSWRLGKKSRALRDRLREEGAESLPLTPTRNFLRKWEGRRYTSNATFLGFPLVSIAFSDPDRDFCGDSRFSQEKQETATGWIALGDKARGLFAFGNIAIGGFAFGGVSIGLVSFGGIAIGGVALGGLTVAGLSLGGLALGIGAIGGLAVGLWAFGGGAVAWIAAKGGFAYAREYAIGGEAIAEQANNDAAKAYVEESSFFGFGDSYMALLQHSWFLPATLLILLAFMGVGLVVSFRRKQVSSSSESA